MYEMRKTAFTFIEVMIAIFVFAVGILAVLRVMTTNLGTIDTAEVKQTATILAQEGLELVYNLRDTNRTRDLSRDCLLDQRIYTDNTFATDDICTSSLRSGIVSDQVLQIGFSPDSYVYYNWRQADTTFSKKFTTNQLYRTDWYNYQTGEETWYARYVVVTGVRLSSGNTMVPIQNAIGLESHVLYQKGAMTGDVVLKSVLGNY